MFPETTADQHDRHRAQLVFTRKKRPAQNRLHIQEWEKAGGDHLRGNAFGLAQDPQMGPAASDQAARVWQAAGNSGAAPYNAASRSMSALACSGRPLRASPTARAKCGTDSAIG